MPLRSTWLAAMSMTLMMKAMAKAQIRLLRTHVWRICWLEQAVAARQGAPERDRRGQQSIGIRSHLHFRTWTCPEGCTSLGQARKPPAPSASPCLLPLKQLAPPEGSQVRLTLHVHGALLGRAQVALLFCHDDVFNVLHGQVFAEGVVEQPFQLVHSQLLHVTLEWWGRHNALATTTATIPTQYPAATQAQ